jgi:anaerobic carbon-monoxide dehydrogenase iron sulfur subunit
MTAKVNESCDRCGTCISVCPANALLLLSESLVIDAALCTGCGTCVKVCPFGALFLEPDPKPGNAALASRKQ